MHESQCLGHALQAVPYLFITNPLKHVKHSDVFEHYWQFGKHFVHVLFAKKDP